MSSVKFKDVIEFAGIVAIILGLLFVYAEIRQNGTIARAQLSSETARIFFDLNEQERDENFSKVVAKSYESPEELTSAERIQMNAYLSDALRYTYRERYYYALGLFETWDDGIWLNAPYFFGRGYGRVWWDVHKKMHHPEVVARIDEALANPEWINYFGEADREIVELLHD